MQSIKNAIKTDQQFREFLGDLLMLATVIGYICFVVYAARFSEQIMVFAFLLAIPVAISTFSVSSIHQAFFVHRHLIARGKPALATVHWEDIPRSGPALRVRLENKGIYAGQTYDLYRDYDAASPQSLPEGTILNVHYLETDWGVKAVCWDNHCSTKFADEMKICTFLLAASIAFTLFLVLCVLG